MCVCVCVCVYYYAGTGVILWYNIHWRPWPAVVRMRIYLPTCILWLWSGPWVLLPINAICRVVVVLYKPSLEGDQTKEQLASLIPENSQHGALAYRVRVIKHHSPSKWEIEIGKDRRSQSSYHINFHLPISKRMRAYTYTYHNSRGKGKQFCYVLRAIWAHHSLQHVDRARLSKLNSLLAAPAG